MGTQQNHDNRVLSYDRPLVVVGGGQIDPSLLTTLSARGFGLIAADGGAAHFARAGLVPDAIIGDLDSLDDRAFWADQTAVIQIDEQATTDFEKCLYSSRAPVTLCMGMTGKRFDHTLAALNVVARYGAQRHLMLIDETDVALALSGAAFLRIPADTRVSISPLQPVTFARSEGLAYDLGGIRMAPDGQTGTSNRTVGSAVRIEPAEGEMGLWLLILPLAHLDALLSLAVSQAA